MGEDGVRAAGGRHVILRTSWVFSATGSNFVRTMLRLADQRDRIDVVADQVGGPTPAAALARACLTIAQALQDGAPGGTYHLAGAPDVSWAGFAREIFARTGKRVAVAGVPSMAYPTVARRPRNSRLDCASLEDDFGIKRPDWRAGLDEVLATLGALA
jgi:dTDP-4-dehydrorhamnose reductase